MLTHIRQHQLLHEHRGEKGWERSMTRGVHRDRAWYSAIAEAAPKYLGITVPPSVWPTGPRTRQGTLTEVEMTHWPESLRMLADAGDPRLPRIVERTAVDVQHVRHSQPVRHDLARSEKIQGA